jgi:hypothetical protein
VFWSQILFGVVLVIVLLGLAGFYAWRQVLVLRRVRAAEAGGEEGIYLRRQAWRRLASSALMVLLAALLVGAFLFLEGPAQQLADRVDAEGPQAAEGPEQKSFVNFYSSYWIAFLLLLLVLVILAGFDLWAVRRFGLRELRRLQEDRRAMIARQSALLRQRREQQE